MAKHLQYVTGYEDGKKNGRLELANELNQALFELKRNHTVVNISTVIQMIDNRKLIYKKIDGYIKKEEHQFLTNSEKRRCELTHNKRKNEKWCITTSYNTTDSNNTEILYLGWQKASDGSGIYFWTSKEIIEGIINKNNTLEHPFIFNSRNAAIKHLKTLHIPQKCRVIKWK